MKKRFSYFRFILSWESYSYAFVFSGILIVLCLQNPIPIIHDSQLYPTLRMDDWTCCHIRPVHTSISIASFFNDACIFSVNWEQHAPFNPAQHEILLVIPCLFMEYEKILMVWVRITRGWKSSVIRTQTINIVRIAWEQTGGNEFITSKHEFYSKSFENARENAWKIVFFISFIMLQSILVLKISRLDWQLCVSFLSTSRSTTRCS